ncbi:MAG: exo-alpha-sialidase [Verrucomicrobiota bacterium]|nr:exo-alpha-sialidase [Verrucomicrobiota bacterium]
MTLALKNLWTHPFCLLTVALACHSLNAAALRSETITPPLPYNDSPNIIEVSGGILMVWTAGSRPDYADVTVQRSHWSGKNWSSPKTTASYSDRRSGVQEACTHPVLTRGPDKQMALFYQTGARRELWKGHVKFTYDGGYSWTPSSKLPAGIHGPIKGRPVELSNGKLLCPSSDASAGWRVHMEFANPFRERWGWTKTRFLNFPSEYRATEPVILMHDPKRIQVLCRTKQGYMTEIWTTDGAKTWSTMRRTALPNPNSSFDVIRLTDGRFAMVYNHSTQGKDRIHLAVSSNGKEWEAVEVLDQSPSESFENPSMIQSENGIIHIVYSMNRKRFRHVQVDPIELRGQPLRNGIWPLKQDRK